MLLKFRTAGLVWVTLSALAALAMLLSLGTWQMSRKAWKDGLIAQILARSAAEPVDWQQIIEPILRDGGSRRSIEAAAYTRVQIRGQWDHAGERHLYAPSPLQGPGYHVFTPLRLTATEDSLVVMVNRGFVAEALKDPAKRSEGLTKGDVTLTGLLRPAGGKGAFVPSNDPARNVWFWPDLEAMSGRFGLDRVVAAQGNAAAVEKARAGAVTPFYLDAEAEPANPGGWPKGGMTNLRLPNRHLEYAVTWYGLALTLIGVYAAFAWGRLRVQK